METKSAPTECFMGCTPEPGSDERFFVMSLPELSIYGHTVDAWVKEKFPEDWPLIQGTRSNGMEWGCFHSSACPDGEIGSNDPRGLLPISQELFEMAREAGWPDFPILTSLAPAAAVFTVDEDGNLHEEWNSLEGDAR